MLFPFNLGYLTDVMAYSGYPAPWNPENKLEPDSFKTCTQSYRRSQWKLKWDIRVQPRYTSQVHASNEKDGCFVEVEVRRRFDEEER